MQKKNKSTYVIDQEDTVELTRLINLDRLLTQAMGGPLSGLSFRPSGEAILDLACGPGGWPLDVAFECPDCEVAGVDSSQSMIQYAIARARSQKLTNVSFGVMDITQPLDFSDASFTLVNARFLVGVLRREAWMPFLKECTRILKPGGTLRLTEPIDMGETTSPAGNRLSKLMSEAICRAGYGFSVDGHGMGMSMTLPSLLREMNYQHVRTLPHLLDYSEDQSSAWGDMKRQLEAGSRLTPPFFERIGLLSQEETQGLFQQAYQEHHQKGLRGAWHFVTVLGEKPS